MKTTIISIAIVFFFITPVYSDGFDDIRIVAEVIAAEACGEGYKGMYGVGSVISNRSKQWGKTAVQIVTAKNQFYGYSAKNKHKLFQQCKGDALRIANLVSRGKIEDITQGALYFRQPSEPTYSWHGEPTVRIGNHIFHKEKK